MAVSPEETEVQKCPYCLAEISIAAKKCRHCGEWVHSSKKIDSTNTFDLIPNEFITDIDLILNNAKLLYDSGKYKEALQQYVKATELDPKCMEAFKCIRDSGWSIEEITGEKSRPSSVKSERHSERDIFWRSKSPRVVEDREYSNPSNFIRSRQKILPWFFLLIIVLTAVVGYFRMNDSNFEIQYRKESSYTLFGKGENDLTDRERKALDFWIEKQKTMAKANNQCLREYETSTHR